MPTPHPETRLRAVMLDLETARAILALLDAASEIDPALRPVRDALWDAIIDAQNRAVEGTSL